MQSVYPIATAMAWKSNPRSRDAPLIRLRKQQHFIIYIAQASQDTTK